MSCDTCDDVNVPILPGPKTAEQLARQQELVQQQGEIDARRVMCISCPHRRGAAWATPDRPLGTCRAAIALTRDGVPVAGQPLGLMIAGIKGCPRGRYPDQDGRVRWMGISWLGVPMPIRLAARAMGRNRGGVDRIKALPGCGCIERLKVGTNRLASVLGLR